MNYEWIMKTIKKKSDPKMEKKPVKFTVKLPHVNKKSLARKRIFVQTAFSHSTLKLELTEAVAGGSEVNFQKQRFKKEVQNHEQTCRNQKE